MATNLSKVLRYIMIDKETKQTVAGFSTYSSAIWFLEVIESRTGREYIIKETRG